MKRSFCFLFLIFLSGRLLYAQPERSWATYYGWLTFSDGTYISATAYDRHAGVLYVAGYTSDTAGIATPGSYKEHCSDCVLNQGRDIFLVKFDTLGHRIWGTYYGGSGDEKVPRIALDSSGNVYLAGMTQSSTDIATPGTQQPLYTTSGLSMVPFLVKFDSAGNRLWATYCGSGPFAAVATYDIDVAYDRHTNSVYLAGSTTDTADVATPGSFKDHAILFDASSYLYQSSAYLVKFNSNGQRQWGTYYGGDTAQTAISSLYVDNSGNIYAAGYTSGASGIATAGSDQSTFGTSFINGFLVKFDSLGNRLWGTYTGTGGESQAGCVTGDGGTAVYLEGSTYANVIMTTPNCYQPAPAGSWDMFLNRYDGSGTKIWSTYYGGPGSEPSLLLPERARNLSLADNGDIYMAGNTTSNQGIEQGCGAYPATHHDGFITRWRPSGQLLWGSYYDGQLSVISAGAGDQFFVAGRARYDSLASLNALQTTLSGGGSGIIAAFTSGFSCPERHFHIDTTGGYPAVDSGYALYQWYLDGNAVAGIDQPVFTGTDSGMLYVVISDSCKCSYLSDTISWHPAVTGLGSRVPEVHTIRLYPNPGNGRITLSGSLEDADRRVQLVLTDVTGRVLGTASFRVNGKSFRETFDYSYLDSGLYFVRLREGQSETVFKLIRK